MNRILRKLARALWIAWLGMALGCGGPLGTPAPSGREAHPPVPSPSIPTASLIPSPTIPKTSTATACRRLEPNLETPEAAYLPNLAGWSWEELPLPGTQIRQLAGFPFPPILEESSPDGRWLKVRLELHPQMFGAIAEALIDREGSQHRWLVRPPDERILYTWLPDGRPVWGYGKSLFLGEPPQAQSLNPPTEITWIWRAANGILFARDGEGELWRMEIRSGRWERVISPRPPQTGKLGNAFTLAPDGTYGLAVQPEEPGIVRVWRIPARIGAPAEPLPELKLRWVGREGSPEETQTQALGDGPYWYVFMPNEELGEGFLLDLRTGRVIRPTDLGLPQSLRFWKYFVHPSGEWVAIALLPAGHTPQGPEDPTQILYLTPVTDLRAGIQQPGALFVAWLEDPAGIVLREAGAETLRAMRLERGGRITEVPLKEVGLPLGSARGVWLGVERGTPARLLQLTPEGHIRERLDLSPFYARIEWIRGHGDRVYLGAVLKTPGPDGTCRYALVEWASGP